MANELQYIGNPDNETGLTVVATVTNPATGSISGNISCIQTAPAVYVGTMPTGFGAGDYLIRFYAGGILLGQGDLQWNGIYETVPVPGANQTLADYVADFMTLERPAGTVLDSDTVLAQGIAATRYYCGFIDLAAWQGVSPEPAVAGASVLDLSEWALIRPLFLLYVERENALFLEASRALGMDVYGRSVSEVSADIARYEEELPPKCFSQAIIMV